MVATPVAQQRVEGIVERLTYHDEKTGFAIVQVDCDGNMVTVKGKFPSISPGQYFQFLGNWRTDAQWGRQFIAERAVTLRPSTLAAIEKYLGSGMIEGIGPVMAKRIVDHFGIQTLDVIEQDIRRLIEVPGIGKVKCDSIAKSWEDKRAVKDIMMFLQGHGITPGLATKIYKAYEAATIQIVGSNPYCLADDIKGVGFLMADRIARSMDVPRDSSFRYMSAIAYVLDEATGDGDCFLPEAELIKRTIELLKEEADEDEGKEEWKPASGDLRRTIINMEKSSRLVLVEDIKVKESCLVYLPSLHRAEEGVVKHVKRLLQSELDVDIDRVRRWLDRFVEVTGKDLTDEQRQAVELASRRRLMIISGGPGTGKSFTSGVITALLKKLDRGLMSLAAPTGRAAQRLSEMSKGMEARTLHRLLEFRGEGWGRNDHNPLESKVILIDETSMMDVFLAHALLRAIADGAQVILVGDVNQLPSVGPGAILRDLIQSKQVPVVMLTQVHRQAQGSKIIVNAHRVNTGHAPELLFYDAHFGQSDFLFYPVNEPIDAPPAISQVVADLQHSLGYDPGTDMQVLSLMLKGVTGVKHLNKFMQGLINPTDPSKAELVRGEKLLRLGDRVIQMKNNYELDVFNGDVGRIVDIDAKTGKVAVSIGKRTVAYDKDSIDQLNLAYSITVHRSQGSEYPVVIIPMFTEAWMLLSRNLFYTGITRGRELVVVIGQEKAVNIAVKEIKDRKRNTRVAELLKEV